MTSIHKLQLLSQMRKLHKNYSIYERAKNYLPYEVNFGESPLKKILYFIALLITSGIFLTVIQAPFDVSWLAWVAWTPFILACKPDIRKRVLLPTAYGVGLLWWWGNLYWLAHLTFAGYLIFGMVQACYWPLLALSVQFVRRKRWPLFLTAPLIFVGAEAIQGVLFTGFSWYFLAHSQYQNLSLIQMSDIFGALGVSVLIAMVNGLVADWVLAKNRAATVMERANREQRVSTHSITVGALKLSSVLVALLLAGNYMYGYHQLAETHMHRSEGPLVASVQTNLPSFVKEKMDNAQQILNDLIAQSDQCIDAGAELVIWPETIVLEAMNPGYLSYLKPDAEALKFREQILAHCKDRTYLLFGANSADVGVRNGQFVVTDQYNSSFLYRPDGYPDPRIYHKIHLVPFGEYIPFKKSAPWIYKQIMSLSPYDYDYNLTPGTDYTTFTINDDGQEYRFGVLICYEDTDPTVTRRLALNEKTNKKRDWLVNQSNDGWYGSYKDGMVHPYVELAQRAAITVFRCIENRISVIRSVNTGISCLVEPTGKIRDGFVAGTLPEPAMERQGVEGWFAARIPLDDRVTLFSRYGRWLDVILGSSWSIILILSIYSSWTRKPKLKEQKK